MSSLESTLARYFMRRALPLLVILTSSASAATIVQTGNFAFVPNGSRALTFNDFDTLGGTRILTSVTVTVVLNKSGGTFAVDNDSTETGTVSLNHDVIGSLTASGVVLLRDDLSSVGAAGTLTATSSFTTGIAATTGDDTNSFNNTGAGDYLQFLATNASDSDTGAIGNSFIGTYVGSGTYTVTINANQSAIATGLSGLQQAFTVSSVSGSVTVTYNFDGPAVPEPSATLLGGLGMLTLLRRRRR